MARHMAHASSMVTALRQAHRQGPCCASTALSMTQGMREQAAVLHCTRVCCCCLQASVGAGLPVLSTAHSLLCTGDRISTVEGVFSGTLSYIFNTFGLGRSFSEVVMEAKAKGYTEPDPRLEGLSLPNTQKTCPTRCAFSALCSAMLCQQLLCRHSH